MNQSHNGCTVYITLHIKLSKLIECHACKHCLLYLPCMFDFLDQLFFFFECSNDFETLLGVIFFLVLITFARTHPVRSNQRPP